MREIANKVGNDKITRSHSINQDGYVVDARELNPANTGGLSNKIENLSALVGKMKTYKSFEEIPIPQYSYTFSAVIGPDTDSTPLKGQGWWGVITFGESNRVIQMAFCPFGGVNNKIYFRQKHDARWSGWWVIAGSAAG